MARSTLFEGLEEMQEVVVEPRSSSRSSPSRRPRCSSPRHAASAGQHLPRTFIGVALGVLLVVSHSGWLSLFISVTIVGQVNLFSIRDVALLPAWLLVTDRPQMEIELDPSPRSQPMPGPGGGQSPWPG